MNIKILEKFEVLNSEILANLVELVIRETIYLLSLVVKSQEKVE